ncbi:threonine/homoserine efflux transporter RhtA [Crenobacter luteus]|uniref:DMT family transporter n=1 Tax=Crenobacter luteus TaxID=1452487 RepID=UPI0010505BA5|nr:DMT family transporter [Crenobacter luteus]TCP15149.1 threonine/homoserine efflux transporter RhtA [Crenobacter luteus]
MPPLFTGHLQILLSAAAFGTMAIFAKLAYQHGLSASQVLFWRFAIAALALAPLIAWRRLPWPSARTTLQLAAMGGAGYALASLCYFTALDYAAAGTVALLLYLYPALVVLLSRCLHAEALTRRRSLALALALSGLAATVGLDLTGLPLGFALGTAAALCYAGYIVAGDRLAGRVHPLVGAFVVIAAAAASNGALLLWQGFRLPDSPAAWSAVLALALVSTVAAIVAFLAGLAKVGATRASLLSTVEPLVTLLLAAAVLGEPLTAAQFVGGALILSAVALTTRDADAGRMRLADVRD